MDLDPKAHLSVIPYRPDTVSSRIKTLEGFDPSTLHRLEWPRRAGRRRAEGGNGGNVVVEQCVVSWQGDKLVYPISPDAQPLAEKTRYGSVRYLAHYLAQMDGEVAYVPSESSASFFVIVQDKHEHFCVLRFAPNDTVVVAPYVKHSMPIPYEGTLEYSVWHRAADASNRYHLHPDHAVVFNVNKVDRSHAVEVGEVPEAHQPLTKLKPLPDSFAHGFKYIEDARADLLEPYGEFISDIYCEPWTAHDVVSRVPWPYASDSVEPGILEQDFRMTWAPDPTGAFSELRFNGISGALEGAEGRPGVEYHPENGVYKANVLMTRPDGTFYIRSVDADSAFILALAMPKGGDGDPLADTLRVFTFQRGEAVRLRPHVWHSVPIPVAAYESLTFRETVAATNANIVINVREETGHPIQFVHGV